MGEIVHSDRISINCIKHISGIVKFEDRIFASSKKSPKTFASYFIETTGKLRYDPIYHDFLPNNIVHTSAYDEKYFIISLKDHSNIQLLEWFNVHLYDLNLDNLIDLVVVNKVTNTTEKIYNSVINVIPSKTNYSKLSLVTAVIDNKKGVYFFVQGRSNNITTLFVVKGSLHEDQLSLTPTFKFLSYYNLYNVGRDAGLSKSDAKELKCSSVAYNPDSNIFVFLMTYGSKGFLGTLNILEGLGSIGGYIRTVTLNCDNHLLKFKSKPRGITYYKDNMYYVITNDTCTNDQNKYAKYFLIKIEI